MTTLGDNRCGWMISAVVWRLSLVDRSQRSALVYSTMVDWTWCSMSRGSVCVSWDSSVFQQRWFVVLTSCRGCRVKTPQINTPPIYASCLFKRKPDVVDLYSYFNRLFFLPPVNGPYFLVDVISVDLFSNSGRFFRGCFFRTPRLYQNHSLWNFSYLIDSNYANKHWSYCQVSTKYVDVYYCTCWLSSCWLLSRAWGKRKLWLSQLLHRRWLVTVVRHNCTALLILKW